MASGALKLGTDLYQRTATGWASGLALRFCFRVLCSRNRFALIFLILGLHVIVARATDHLMV